MNISSYQNDFQPHSYHNFLPSNLKVDSIIENTPYECHAEIKKKDKQCENEWSGIGPMGLLIKPRIIGFIPEPKTIVCCCVTRSKFLSCPVPGTTCNCCSVQPCCCCFQPPPHLVESISEIPSGQKLR